MRLWSGLFLICMMMLSHAQAGETFPEPKPILHGGRPLLSESPSAYSLLAQPSDLMQGRIIEALGTPHGQILRIEVSRTPGEPWLAQVKWPLSGPVAKKQAVLVRVLMRAVAGQPETGAGKAELAAQRTKSPWGRLCIPVSPKLTLGRWVWVDLPLESPADLAAGDAEVTLNLGYFPQIVEIASVQAYGFAANVDIKDLPQPEPYTYDGRQPDAAWRAAAQERIERYRKGDLILRVQDASGRAVADAAVSIRMKKHAFLFGTCINGTLLRQDADGQRYRQEVKDQFNLVVHEGDMKWTAMVWQGGKSPTARMKTAEEQQTQIDKVRRMLDWCEANGIKTRGHTLIWPGWGPAWAYLPPYLKPMVATGDNAAVEKEIENRIRTATAAFKGRLIEWDVVNESVVNHDLQDFLGRQAMVSWYKLARDADPDAKVVINDYLMLSGNAQPNRVNAYYDEIKFLLDHGAPIDAIGEQAHFTWDLPGMDHIYATLERFAGFGKPLRITEFDVAVSDEKLQADFTRDFYTMLFSHPKVEQILMWGFWEGSHWKPQAAMLRKDWSPKPSALVYRDLVFKQWWTSMDARTDADGTFRARGFLGDYDVTATRGEQSGSVSVSLGREGRDILIQLR